MQTMMTIGNKRRLVIIGITCLALAACGREEPAFQEKRYPIGLEADLEAYRTRIVETEDVQEGLKTAWADGDRIRVMFGAGALAELSTEDPASGMFSGEVETSAEAEAFRQGHHYAATTSLQMRHSVVEGALVSVVDLTGQGGTASGVVPYELMTADATAGSTLRFSHRTSIMRLDITSSLLGESIMQMRLIFRPSAGSSALFASEVTWRTGPAGLQQETEDATFFDLTLTEPLPLQNGVARVYIVIPERHAVSGELSIEVTGAAGVSFRRYLNLSGKNFGAGSVVARQVKLTQAHAIPNLGDYYYSDGSWGPLDYYTDKYPIGVIISNYTDPGDRAEGYIHGYAMALRDAAWPTAWGPENTDYAELPNVLEEVSSSAPLAMMENLDGLSKCRTIVQKYLTDNGWQAYNAGRTRATAAVPTAMEYGSDAWAYMYESTPGIHPFEAPASSSGWFLPGVGQWFLALTGLGGLDPEELSFDPRGGFRWTFDSADEKQAYLDRFCNYFSSWSNPVLAQYEAEGAIVQSTFYLPYEGQMDWYLWSCDEATAGAAAALYITANEIIFKATPKTAGEDSDNGYASRPVIAF